MLTKSSTRIAGCGAQHLVVVWQVVHHVASHLGLPLLVEHTTINRKFLLNSVDLQTLKTDIRKMHPETYREFELEMVRNCELI